MLDYFMSRTYMYKSSGNQRATNIIILLVGMQDCNEYTMCAVPDIYTHIYRLASRVQINSRGSIDSTNSYLTRQLLSGKDLFRFL